MLVAEGGHRKPSSREPKPHRRDRADLALGGRAERAARFQRKKDSFLIYGDTRFYGRDLTRVLKQELGVDAGVVPADAKE